MIQAYGRAELGTDGTQLTGSCALSKVPGQRAGGRGHCLPQTIAALWRSRPCIAMFFQGKASLSPVRPRILYVHTRHEWHNHHGMTPCSIVSFLTGPAPGGREV